MIKCPNCGFEGMEKKYTKGHFFIELLLWLFFFPIGIIYSLWRLGSKYKGCPRCGYQYVVKTY